MNFETLESNSHRLDRGGAAVTLRAQGPKKLGFGAQILSLDLRVTRGAIAIEEGLVSSGVSLRGFKSWEGGGSWGRVWGLGFWVQGLGFSV